MAWVPLAQSGIAYQFMVFDPEANEDVPGFPANVTFNTGTSIIELAPPEPTDSEANWELYFDGSTGVQVRVTVIAFESAPSSESPYNAAGIYYFDGVDPQDIFNEVDTDPVDGWEPSPVEFTVWENTNKGDPPIVSYSSSWTGSEVYQPLDREWSMLLEVWVEGPEPPAGCEEIGRVSRAYVSAYNRTATQAIRVRRTERRCVVADFNGAIPAGRSIASVTWRCTYPWVVKMQDAAINGRETQVLATFQFGGFSALKCEATMDNGEVYSQVFDCQVRDFPGFYEDAPVTAGPFVLTVSASD